jgi:hypothetical protein
MSIVETHLKRFMAIYIGIATPAQKAALSQSDPTQLADMQARGMAAWGVWAARNAAQIVDHGAPLGKTKRASKAGISDTTNQMTAYAIVQAESHDEAARLFQDHPHFAVFPGEAVEIMEILPMPGASHKT